MRDRARGTDGADAVAVDILRMSPEGDGVASLGGEDVVVPRTIPGEQVEVAVRRGRDGSLAGEVIRVVRPSPDRVVARCRHFGYCGGCAWQHIAYPAQLRLKQAMLQEMLAATMGAAAPRVLAPVPTPRREAATEEVSGGRDPDAPWGYRDKVSFVFAPAGRQALVMGHYRRGTRSAFAAGECPVHVEAGN